MGGKPTLSDLRNGIEDIYRQMMREEENGEAPNATVLSRVRTTMATELDFLTPQLLDIALTKLLNEVSYRRGSNRAKTAGSDLFGDYRIPSRVTIVRGSKKDTLKLSVREFKLYLEAHSKKAMSDRYEPYRLFLEDHLKFVNSDDDILEAIIQRKRKFSTLPIPN
jgi:hypothetical protein